jgi:predicted ribosomally synthesized peptide with nif11-like leader
MPPQQQPILSVLLRLLSSISDSKFISQILKSANCISSNRWHLLIERNYPSRRKQMTTTITTKTTTNLEGFYQEVLKDPMLQERLKAATDPESLCELAVALAKEKGYSFTKEEALAAMAIEAAMGGEYVEIGESFSQGSTAFACSSLCSCGGCSSWGTP